MLQLAARRAVSARAPAAIVARTMSHGPGTTPDTGGPLFSTQFGVPIHKPKTGGDQRAAEAKRKEEPEKKKESKAHKVTGGYSFAELKRLHQDGRD